MLSAKLNTPPQDVTFLALSATSVCLFHGGMISEQTATIKLKGAWNLDSTRSSTNFHFPLMPPALFASFHKVHNKVITSMKTYFNFYMLLYCLKSCAYLLRFHFWTDWPQFNRFLVKQWQKIWSIRFDFINGLVTFCYIYK